MKSFNDLINRTKGREIKKLVVAAAADEHVMESTLKAAQQNIVQVVYVGHEGKIRAIAKRLNISLSDIEIVNEPNDKQACLRAVEMVKSGNADILMKGMVATSTFLQAILDNEDGIKKSDLLSHVALFASPYYHKLLCITDVALNIEPDLTCKVSIVNNAVDLYHRLGVVCPKVAAVAPVEVVNPKMEATIHAAALSMMCKRKQLKECLFDGPLGLDNIVSMEAADIKGIISEVSGDVDIILVPDLNSGNIFYKALNFLGGASSAAIVMGATNPIVLTSRADSEESKYMSIVLAAAMD